MLLYKDNLKIKKIYSKIEKWRADNINGLCFKNNMPTHILKKLGFATNMKDAFLKYDLRRCWWNTSKTEHFRISHISFPITADYKDICM